MKRAIALVSYSTSNLHNVEAELQLRLDSSQKLNVEAISSRYRRKLLNSKPKLNANEPSV